MQQASKILAFSAQKLIAEGAFGEVLQLVKNHIKQNDTGNILFFNGSDGRQIDIDLQSGAGESGNGSKAAAAESGSNQAIPTKKPRGRPKLGVVGREVTLLPRHWQWLDKQRGGASARLRRLIDQERKATAGDDMIRESQDSANRFMYAMAGDIAGFEEAVRALYARDKAGFDQETAAWPVDIRDRARGFAEAALI